MEPINYLANVPNPAGAVFEGLKAGTQQQADQQRMQLLAAQEGRAAELQPYAVQGEQLGLDQGRQSMTVQAEQNARANELQPLQVQAQQQQIAAQQREQQRAQAFQAEAARLAGLGGSMTIADLNQVVTEFPEYGREVVGSFEAMNKAQQNSVAGVMAQAAFALKNGNVATANDLIDEYAAAADASGNPQIAATARAIQQTAEISPDAALMSLGLALQTVAPEAAAKIFDAGQMRVQSTQNVGPTLTVQTMTDGTTRVVDTITNQTLTGDAAQSAINAAQEAEILQAGAISDARTRATQENRLEFGPQTVAAEATAKALANIGVDAQREAPSIIAKSQAGMDLIDNIIADPKLPSILGAVQGRITAGTPLTGGTGGGDIAAKVAQLQGQAFLTAFESLKGGGTITEVEGLKAEQALARLQRTQSPEAFRQSLLEFRDVLEAAKLRAEGNLVPDVFDGSPFPINGVSGTQPAATSVPSYLQQYGGN